MADIDGTSGDDTLSGFGSDDTINGLGGADSITTGGGSDVVHGGDGDDTVNGSHGGGFSFGWFVFSGPIHVYGDGGNDVILGTDGADTLEGGTGDDAIGGLEGADSILGGSGNDTIAAMDGDDTVDGGADDDSIHGGDGADSILGSGGNDTVFGSTGLDTIKGGDGADSLQGDGGDDSLEGGEGNDTLYGGDDDDTLLGQEGNDELQSNAGDDSADGGSGNDELYGGSGNDTLLGGTGNDSLYGNDDDDSLTGGDGDDELFGTAGNDTLVDDEGFDELYGGADNDTYILNSLDFYINDTEGTNEIIVNQDFVKVPTSVDATPTFGAGVMALPYWLDALLPESANRFKALLGGSTTLSYGFPSTVPGYVDSGDTTDWAAFNTDQQDFVEDVFTYISTVVNLSFVETLTFDAPNVMTFANNAQTGTSGYAYYPNSTSVGSDVYLDEDNAGNLDPMDGEFAALTIIHEIGHALGLKHPFEDGPTLGMDEDVTEWSVMSYEDHPDQYHPVFRPLDLAALHYIYGPSPTANAGATSHVISESAPNFIYDGSGTDEIDASAVSEGVTLYLTPGYWGFVGGSAEALITAAGQITVNFGTIIENLIGTGFADLLVGNDVGNDIDAGAGDDTVQGGNGDDTLAGGADTDTVKYSGVKANYSIVDNGGSFTITDNVGLEGADTVTGFEMVMFSDITEALSAPANNDPVGVPTIDDTTPDQGQLLTADGSGISDDDGLGAFSYQWKANGVDIGSATSSTFMPTQAEVGKTLTVEISYTDGGSTLESVLSAATAAVANVNDLPSGTVTIDDTTPAQGDTLNASNTLADIDGLSGPISYQWNRDGAPIIGATGSAYDTVQDDVGTEITVTASYTDDLGTPETKDSAATAAVTNVNDLPGGDVTIDDTTPTEGDTLSAANTLTDADGLSGPISYQWNRDGAPIFGATGDMYTTIQADVGTTISVTASYTDDLGTPESVTSDDTAAVINLNSPPGGTVTIDNTTPAQGDTLTASNTLTDADGLSGEITYQWNRNGTPIGGATDDTYTTTQDDVGATITVTASYTDDLGTPEMADSTATAAVTNVNDDPTGTVVITGDATEDSTLTADTSGLDDPDGIGDLSYQWKADGEDIDGATGMTYDVVQEDVGKVITVMVSYEDDGGASEDVTSAATAAVANVNDDPGGTLTIDGTASQGETLTANNLITDEDGISGGFTYQWNRDGAPIDGATSDTYDLIEDDVGTMITVTVNYTDDQGTDEEVTSDPTGMVTDVNFPPTGSVTISGTPTEDETLTASNDLDDPDGNGDITYQWKADGVNIDGATEDTLVLTQSEVGKVITVTASYTDGGGTLESENSMATTAVLNVNDDPVGSVTVGGGAIVGQTLTASNDVTDEDGISGLISYQWKADEVPIGGATGMSYEVSAAETGKRISVDMFYTDDGGMGEIVSSGATIPVVVAAGVLSPLDLDGSNGFILEGDAALIWFGYSVSDAGDVNDDGIDDIIVGAYQADANGLNSGSAFVIFGSEAGFPETFDVATLDGSNGFRIDGVDAGDFTGRSVSGAGDVNGDGVDDVIIGAYQANDTAGSAFVVFGSSDAFTAAMDLSTLDGTNGFRMNGQAAGNFMGNSVSGAGDINNDGFDDVIVGAQNAGNNGLTSGSGYVVFGTDSGFSAVIELSDLNGSDGFRVDGSSAEEFLGISVSSAGDVNGDFKDDFIVGAYGASNEGAFTGSSYVVFGTEIAFDAIFDPGTLDGTNGFRIDGEAEGDLSGYSVKSAGDVNGDGIDDLIVSSYLADPNGFSSGSTYVVFGQSSAFSAVLKLKSLDGLNGFRLDGVAEGDSSGLFAKGVGDVNGDSYDDVMVGAYRADSRAEDSGSAYLVYGRAGGFDAVIELASLDGEAGLRFDGTVRRDFAGQSVSSAGDLNNDGVGDYIVGAYGDDPNGSFSGAAYVVFGTQTAMMGSVTDDYIAGAAIFVDDDDDGIPDPEEDTGITTDANGFFEISAGLLTGPIIAVGGTDTGTNLPNTLILSSPEGKTLINPSTTLIQGVIAAEGGSAESAEAKIQAALGIEADLDLMEYDPLAVDPVDETALRVQQIAAQIAVLVALSGDNGTFDDIVAYILANPGVELDLSSQAQLSTILPEVDDEVLVQAAAVNSVIAQAGSFADISQAQSGALNEENDAPIVSGSLSDQDAVQDVEFNYQVPAGTFTDLDAGDTLIYTATLDDNSPLPTWLSFDAGTQTFSGTPVQGDSGQITVKVTATDEGAESASTTFTLTVDSGGDLIDGTPDNDSLVGGDGNDTINGYDGRDTLEGGAGDDELNGGDDIDTAVFHSGLLDYTIVNSGGEISVSGDADGADTLNEIERLQFDDTNLAFDLDGSPGDTAKLLAILLGPDPVQWYNPDLVGIGIDAIDNLGFTFESLMALAIDVVLPGASDGEVVDHLFFNLAGVATPQDLKDDLVGLLGDGTFTRASLAVVASEIDLHLDNMGFDELILVGVEYNLPA